MREAALKNKWNEATYRAHETGKRSFKYDAALEYASAFRVDESWLWSGKGDPKPKGDMPGLTIKAVPVVGEVAAGRWLEATTASEYQTDESAPADPRYPASDQFGLFVRGNSINRIARDGEIVICLDLNKRQANIVDGDPVVVERRREQDGLIEVTAKRVHKIGDAVELLPDSDDPRFSDPSDSRYQPPLQIPLRHTTTGQAEESVAMRALIIGVYRPIHRR